MADRTWPFADGDPRFAPEGFDEALEFDVELTTSRAGRVTTQSLPGARWRLTMNWPDESVAYLQQRRQLEAFLSTLRGGADRLLMWNMLTPQPLGTTRGAPTIGTTVAVGVTSVQLAGCVGINLLLHGSFELDSNSDGLTDGWTAVSIGSVSGVTYTRESGGANDGVYEQGIAVTFGATGSSNEVGVERNTPLAAGPGDYTFLANVRGDVDTSARIAVEWRNSGGTVISGVTVATVAVTGTPQRFGATATAPSGTASVTVRLLASATVSAGARDLRWDSCAVKAGATDLTWPGTATLLRGDRIGIGGQRVMLTEDADANDAGVMTVNFQPPLRAAATAGDAVTVTKPTTRYVLTQPVLQMPARGTVLPGFGLEFVEE